MILKIINRITVLFTMSAFVKTCTSGIIDSTYALFPTEPKIAPTLAPKLAPKHAPKLGPKLLRLGSNKISIHFEAH